MQKSIVFISAMSVLLVAGCAATYKRPTTVAKPVTSMVSGSKDAIMKAAKQALVSDGYQITNSDEADGILSTAPRDLHVSLTQADCGTTMGINYLKDNRTTTRVAYGVIASDGKLTVKANIQGEYRPGAVDQDVTLTCVSSGELERHLIADIKANLPHS